MPTPTRLHRATLAPFLAALGLLALLTACGDDGIANPGTVDTVGDVSDTADTPSDTGGDTVPGPDVRCTTPADCTDELACTIDTCGPKGVCVWTLAAGSCLVNHVCYADGAAHPSDPCAVCDAEAEPLAFSSAADGASCDDGDACTEATTCQAGACVGTAAVCEDDTNPCTAASCDAASGCQQVAIAAGTACDDGSLCTSGDACFAGACLGVALGCDDGNPCTDDTCDPAGGCTSVPNTAPCDDGDACTAGDTCADGACVPGGPETCDDGNACSIDLCDVDVGCVHLPTQNPCCIGLSSVCEDGNPCTEDLCDALTGDCDYVATTAACDDGDACTSEDACAEGTCVGTALGCDDGNPCTTDACHPTQGCYHAPLGEGACDDGFACTTGDTCVAGQCVGDSSGCVCEPTFSDLAAKLTDVQLGEGGYPGEGLDLDGDPTTCAPSGECSDGIDNALGVLAAIANEPLAEAVVEGSVMLTVELKDLGAGGHLMAVYQSELAPESEGCDFQTQTCAYLIDAGTVHPATCAPVVSLPATLVGDVVTAGGPGTLFPFSIPFQGENLNITLYDVRFEGTVTLTDGKVAAVSGVIGGAVPKAELVAAILALPDDALPVPKDTIVGLLDVLVVNDVDTDGDGVPDAASIGIAVSGIGATLVGLAP